MKFMPTITFLQKFSKATNIYIELFAYNLNFPSSDWISPTPLAFIECLTNLIKCEHYAEAILLSIQNVTIVIALI